MLGYIGMGVLVVEYVSSISDCILNLEKKSGIKFCIFIRKCLLFFRFVEISKELCM